MGERTAVGGDPGVTGCGDVACLERKEIAIPFMPTTPHAAAGADPLAYLKHVTIARCCKEVILKAGADCSLVQYVGMTHSDLVLRVAEYRKLKSLQAQAEVLSLLAMMRGIASVLSLQGVWYFYDARKAPQGALHGTD